MSSRLVKLFGFFALVVVLSYIYVLNPSDVTVNISRSRAWIAPLALVLITTFSLGIFVTALIGFFIGARVSFQHWRERKRFQQVEEHHRRLERIREELVSENWDRACGALKRVIDEDPENVVARSMYAEALCRMKHFNEAFMVLDEARASFADNRELPILAARIHMERGNYTAALDNFAIVLKGDPDNQYALRNAKICAAKLGQYQHAVSFIERLARVASPDELRTLELEHLNLLIAKAKKDHSADAPVYRAALESLRKDFRDLPATYRELGALDQKLGNVEASAKLYAKAYVLSHDADDLAHVANLWLTAHEPSKAVSAVRAAISSDAASTREGLSGRSFFVRLLLHLEMNEEARAELRRLRADVVAESSAEVSDRFEGVLDLFDARLLERTDKIEQALDLMLTRAFEQDRTPGGWLFQAQKKDPAVTPRTSKAAPEQPSPLLSTP